MADNMWEKYRTEREKNLSKGPKHGKQANQRLKTYVVLQYLLKYSDESHPKSAYDIIGYLETCGISAERRSIYKDIEDIISQLLQLVRPQNSIYCVYFYTINTIYCGYLCMCFC